MFVCGGGTILFTPQSIPSKSGLPVRLVTLVYMLAFTLAPNLIHCYIAFVPKLLMLAQELTPYVLLINM